MGVSGLKWPSKMNGNIATHDHEILEHRDFMSFCKGKQVT